MSSVVPFVVATVGALAMALAFPKTNATALAPIGAVGLFWAWFVASPKRAFLIGWLAGTAYFGVSFRWFGETAGALIAPFGFVLALGPAIVEAAIGFGLAGVLASLAARGLRSESRAARALAPAGAAAGFAFLEWLRSEGMGELGVPFASLGFTQVASPVAPLASFAGTYGVTFALCAVAAYAAAAILARRVRGLAWAAGVAVACSALAWLAWPARAAAAPTVRVAALQGNIAQGIKFSAAAFPEAVARYESLTLRAAASRPSIIVWPETVIPTALNQRPELQARFRALARRTGATLAVGTLDIEPGADYNVLWFFSPGGGPDVVYRKRQLVPFAEHLPFAQLLAWIPWTSEVSHFVEGTDPGLVGVGGLRYGPIVCWESAFGGLVRGDVRAGATALIVSTDDAWFGTTAGPYQHSEIARMRAIETGRWIVRAASTGISGIIAPDGRYAAASALDTQAVVEGALGTPVDTAYDAIGPGVVAALLAALYACATIAAFRRGRA